jgi:hypothetical protein
VIDPRTLRRPHAALLAALLLAAPGPWTGTGLASSPGAPPAALPGCGTREDHVVPAPPGSIATLASVCPARGPCDNPAVRDTTGQRWLNLRAVVHVFRRGDGTGGPSQALVDATLAQINHDFRSNGTGVQVDVVAVRHHDSDTYYCLPPCEALHQCQDSFTFLRTIQSLFAEDPEHQLNIYITCHPDSPNGTLAGISYFPWSSSPLGTPGGFWVNVASGLGAGNFVATHELGHNLGLYHTFRGVAEIDSCGDPCAENVTGVDNDVRGDFAADTPPTPVNPDCGPPAGTDCLGNPWGSTQPENLMGYGPPGCQTLFTDDQIRRLQCWTMQTLRSWLSSPPAPCERLADAGTSGLWRFNEVAGVVALDELGGPAGELIGGAGRGTSACGSPSLALAGAGQGLRLDPAVIGRLPAGTVECTFQWDGSDPGAEGAWIFDQSSGPGASNLGLALAADGTLRLHVQGAERLASVTVIRPLRWYRAAASWDGVRVRLDLDDLMDAETASAAVPDSLGAFLWFGRSGGTVPDGSLAGGLDELRISHVARTASRPAGPAVAGIEFSLAPNPAVSSVALRFALPHPGRARLEVFDLAGRRVATLLDRELAAGGHTLRWDGVSTRGDRVRSGVYAIRLTAAGATARRTLAWMP